MLTASIPQSHLASPKLRLMNALYIMATCEEADALNIKLQHEPTSLAHASETAISPFANLHRARYHRIMISTGVYEKLYGDFNTRDWIIDTTRHHLTYDGKVIMF